MNLQPQFESRMLIPEDAIYRTDSDTYVWKNHRNTEHPINERYESFQDGYEVAHSEALPLGHVRADLVWGVIQELEERRSVSPGNAPGHDHQEPGIWDSTGNPEELRGKPCEWCRKWNYMKLLLCSGEAAR